MQWHLRLHGNAKGCQTHLYVGVLQADVGIGEVGEVVDVEDEGFGVLLGLGLGENAHGAVLGVGPPPLLAVRLRIQTLDLVLLLQRSQLDIATETVSLNK